MDNVLSFGPDMGEKKKTNKILFIVNTMSNKEMFK